MINDIKYVIVPDVHGRDFYEHDVNMFLENTDDVKIIFLGDYIDPYPREKITPNDALKRFKSIIKLKKKYGDRITLLLGNHDFHYIDGSRKGCRMDFYNKDEICGLFLKNMDLFEYVKCERIGKTNFIFSHAGFGFAWFSYHSDLAGVCDPDNHDEDVERKAFTYNTIKNVDWKGISSDRQVLNAYGDIGSSRGGWCNHPSFMWADVTDILMDNDIKVANCVQVFGHTMQNIGQPLRFDNCFCLDCQKVFYINDKGTVLTDQYKPIRRNGEEYKKAYLEYLKRYSAFFL